MATWPSAVPIDAACSGSAVFSSPISALTVAGSEPASSRTFVIISGPPSGNCDSRQMHADPPLTVNYG